MSYTVNFIYGVTYTRNNQIIFPQDLAGVKIITQTCAGNFFTYQRTLRAKLSDITSKTPLKEVVGARVLPNNSTDDEFFYFINGYTIIASNVVEFNIEPDHFHTYLFSGTYNPNSTATVRGILEQSTLISGWNYPFGNITDNGVENLGVYLPTRPSQNTLPKYTPLVKNSYMVVAMVAIENDIFVFATRTTSREGVYSYAGNYRLYNTAWLYTGLDSEGNKTYSKMGAYKVLRMFFIPSEFIDLSLETSTGYITTSNATPPFVEGMAVTFLTRAYSKNYELNYNETALEKYITVGTALTSIQISNFTGDKKLTVSVSALENITIFLKIGKELLNITSDFEIDNSGQNEYALYVAQHKTSESIKTIGSVFRGAAQVTSGVAQLTQGNIIGGVSNVASGSFGIAEEIVAREEKKHEITASAGTNVGGYNISTDLYGFGITVYDAEDSLRAKAVNTVYGYYIGGEINEITLLNMRINVNSEFFKFKYTRFTNVSIPATAANELETLFNTGIFIRKFI